MWDWRYKRSTSPLRLERITLDFLGISISRSIDFVGRLTTVATQTTERNGCRRWWSRNIPRRKTMLLVARVLSRSKPKTYMVYSNKDRAFCSEGPRPSQSFLSVLHLSRTLFFLPTFAIEYSLILFGHEPNRDTKLGDWEFFVSCWVMILVVCIWIDI